MTTKYIKRGEIYYANLNPIIGSEQGAIRPVLVVQNNIGNKYSPTIVVIPITCNLKKKFLPTHVKIPLSSGLEVDSLALVEQIRTIDRSRFGEYVGCIEKNVQLRIDDALIICVGIKESHSTKCDMLTLCLCPQCKRNFMDSGCILVKKGWQKKKGSCDFCEARQGFIFGVFNMDGVTVLR